MPSVFTRKDALQLCRSHRERVTEITVSGADIIDDDAFSDLRITLYHSPSIPYGPDAHLFNQIEKVVISAGIQHIGKRAFRNCNSMRTLIIENGTQTIGDAAFSECTALEEMELPESVVSIGSGAFFNCQKLREAVIPSSVTFIDDFVFKKCRELSKIILPEGLTEIGESTFEGCDNLTALDIPDSVVSIGKKAFFECQNLTEIRLPDGLTTVGKAAFSYCKGLCQMHLPDSMELVSESVFAGCGNLTEINIPESVTAIGNHAFYHCENLTRLSLPDGLTSVGYGAFYNCPNLKQLRIFGYTVNSSLCNWGSDLPSDVLKMLREKDYDTQSVSDSTKIEFVMQVYFRDGQTEAESFIMRHIGPVIGYCIAHNHYDAICRLLTGDDAILSEPLVVSLLDKATEHTANGGDVRIQAFLADYKNRLYPDFDPFGNLNL